MPALDGPIYLVVVVASSHIGVPRGRNEKAISSLNFLNPMKTKEYFQVRVQWQQYVDGQKKIILLGNEKKTRQNAKTGYQPKLSTQKRKSIFFTSCKFSG